MQTQIPTGILDPFVFVVMYPEQSYGGQKHAVTEPSVSLRAAAGSDSDENCRPPSSHGKRPVSVLCFMFVDIRFIYY